MIVDQEHHDHPFCDLGAVDSIGAEQRDLGVGIDGVVGDVVHTSGYELDEFEIGRIVCSRRQPRNG